MNIPDPSTERWQRIEAVLDAVLDAPVHARSAILDAHCPHGDDLRRDVEGFLAAAEENGFLDEPAGQFAAPYLAETTLAPSSQTGGVGPGDCIGPYRLLEEIGRGGQGVVYRAERATQDDKAQFDQEVALKLIPRGRDSEQVVRRFLHERQVLARLQHPHIARLLDGGVSEEGRPYFVMEYVEGESITHYCDARHLTVEDRLRLFEAVGDVVHYAHRNLVVHRDLKPSNLLVTPEGEVKLLDFGIAKLLRDEADDGLLTRTGQMLMTPAYAAPEQVRGDTVTTATDVYALGVVLYELLTGHRPYQFASQAVRDIEQAILADEPPRPSTAVTHTITITHRDGTTATITPDKVGTARATDPKRLQKRLSGNLDMVTLKALRKEPERRYASAEAFVEDIKRYLAGLPVTAQRDTLGYRARKFAQRHQWGVAVTAGLILLLAGFAGTLAVQVNRTAQALTRAEAERDKAEGVTELLVNLFGSVDARNRQELKALDMLDGAAEQIPKDLSDQPERQATLMLQLGRVYLNMTFYDRAYDLLTQSLALRHSMLGNDHLDVGESLYFLSLLGLQTEREDIDTEALARASLAIYQAQLGTDHLLTTRAMTHLGNTLERAEKLDEGREIIYASLAIQKRLLDENDPALSHSLHALGSLEYSQGRPEEAARAYREALAIRRHHADTVGLMATTQMMGSVLSDLEQYEEAEAFLREAIALHEYQYRKANPTINNRLATAIQGQGRYAEAETIFREVLADQRRMHGDESWAVAAAANNLAVVLKLQERYAEAEPYAREALAIYQAKAGKEHLYTGIATGNLGRLLDLKGDYAQAAVLLEEGFRIAHLARGIESTFAQKAIRELVRFYGKWNEPEKADPYRAMLADTTATP